MFARDQQLFGGVGVEGTSEVEPLGESAADAGQRVGLSLVLHSFGDWFESEGVGDLNDRSGE